MERARYAQSSDRLGNLGHLAHGGLDNVHCTNRRCVGQNGQGVKQRPPVCGPPDSDWPRAPVSCAQPPRPRAERRRGLAHLEFAWSPRASSAAVTSSAVGGPPFSSSRVLGPGRAGYPGLLAPSEHDVHRLRIPDRLARTRLAHRLLRYRRMPLMLRKVSSWADFCNTICMRDRYRANSPWRSAHAGRSCGRVRAAA